MTDAIKTGTILIETSALMPASVVLGAESSTSGWSLVAHPGLNELDTAIGKAGWTFFFMAGEIKITAFGVDTEGAVRRAMKRVITNVTSQNCNCVEITEVSRKSFLGMPYVNISAHSRHIQPSSAFASIPSSGSAEREHTMAVSMDNAPRGN
jgi:hypothetical protein